MPVTGTGVAFCCCCCPKPKPPKGAVAVIVSETSQRGDLQLPKAFGVEVLVVLPNAPALPNPLPVLEPKAPDPNPVVAGLEPNKPPLVFVVDPNGLVATVLVVLPNPPDPNAGVVVFC